MKPDLIRVTFRLASLVCAECPQALNRGPRPSLDVLPTVILSCASFLSSTLQRHDSDYTSKSYFENV